MGMFDNIDFKDSPYAKKCKSGHLLHNYQTKSLDCICANFIIVVDVLYKQLYNQHYEPATIYEGLKQYKIAPTALRSVDFNGEIEFYTSCLKCEPVWVQHSRPESICIQTGLPQETWIADHYPWHEFLATFDCGRLQQIKTLKQETRKSIIKKYTTKDSEILLNDHPEVLRKQRSKLS